LVLGDPAVSLGFGAAALGHDYPPPAEAGRRWLHHSARGCWHTSDAYQKTLLAPDFIRWMSRTGRYYDSSGGAAMERFLSTLKHEWAHHDNYTELDEA